MSNILEIGIENGSALLERLGADVPKRQFVRELVKNGIDAGASNIDIDMDWKSYYAQGIKKLMFVDDGKGMDGEDMIVYIAKFASSSSHISLKDNFGFGAKISTFPNNPHGTIYLSRKNGVNYQTRFEKDEESGKWGLRMYERPDGSYGYYTVVDDSVMPDLIMKAGHGTAVILMGKDEQDNTMLAPLGGEFRGFNWLIKEVNSKLYKAPAGVRIRVHHFNNVKDRVDVHGWVVIKGNGYFLERFSESSGSVELTNGQVNWFVIEKEKQSHNWSGVYVTNGHAALVYQNELYGRRDGRMLQNFNINFNSNRVVLYVIPNEDLGTYSNSGRTDLMVGDGSPFPWYEFADEFRSKMPEELINLEKESARASTKKVDQSSIIRNLKSIYEFLQVSRYRPVEDGESSVMQSDEPFGGRGIKIGDLKKTKQKKAENSSSQARPGGSSGSIYEQTQMIPGVPAKEIKTFQPPTVTWVSLEDDSRSVNDELEDRAASYSPRTKTIKANADFRIFQDTEIQLKKVYKNRIGVENLIPSIVRKWYTQELSEVILMAEQLRNTKKWVGPCVDNLTSPEALTCAMLSKYNILRQIQEEIESTISTSSRKAA